MSPAVQIALSILAGVGAIGFVVGIVAWMHSID